MREGHQLLQVGQEHPHLHPARSRGVQCEHTLKPHTLTSRACVYSGARKAARGQHDVSVIRHSRVPGCASLVSLASVSPRRPPCSVGVYPHGSALSPAMYGLALTTCSRLSLGVSRGLYVDHLCRHCSCVPAHPSSYCLPEPTPGTTNPGYMRCNISPPNQQLHLTRTAARTAALVLIYHAPFHRILPTNTYIDTSFSRPPWSCPPQKFRKAYTLCRRDQLNMRTRLQGPKQ